MDKKQVLEELAQFGGDKTEYFRHISGWLDLDDAELEAFRKIVDEAPGKWNMPPEESPFRRHTVGNF